MKLSSNVIGTLGFVAALLVAHAPATAQESGGHAPLLHVSDAHSTCFFELHPELTQGEFDEFADELGSILRSRQLDDPTTLGKGQFELSLQYTNSSIDDTKGAWNNTMSHPTADHYLGRSIVVPRLVARYGVSERVDLGAWGTINPASNYGLVGLDAKIALLSQGDGWPVSLSVRPSVSSLIGPSDVWAGNASIDVSVSRAFGPVSPYLGGATSASLAVEPSDAVDLDPAHAEGSVGYAGVSYRWRTVVVAAEVEKAAVFSFAFRVGTRF